MVPFLRIFSSTSRISGNDTCEFEHLNPWGVLGRLKKPALSAKLVQSSIWEFPDITGPNVDSNGRALIIRTATKTTSNS